MKKQLLGLMAAVGAMAGITAQQTTTTSNSQTQVSQATGENQTSQQNQPGQSTQTAHKEQISFEVTGGEIKPIVYKNSFPPKEYGIYLQRNGLQKWNKKRKKS